MATQWTAGTTSGSVLTAATLNTIGAASVSYTPTWTATVNPAIGNGTLVGSYFQIQKLIIGEIFLVVGSTTTFGTGGYVLSLPAPPSTGYITSWGTLLDASAGYVSYVGVGTVGSGSNMDMRFGNAQPVWQPTVPVTLANADQVRIRFMYERT